VARDTPSIFAISVAVIPLPRRPRALAVPSKSAIFQIKLAFVCPTARCLLCVSCSHVEVQRPVDCGRSINVLPRRRVRRARDGCDYREWMPEIPRKGLLRFIPHIDELTVHGGDFPERTRLIIEGPAAKLGIPSDDGEGTYRFEELTRETVIELTVVSKDEVRRYGRALGIGAATGLYLGPVAGVVIGAVVSGKRKVTTFILKLSDGRRLLATTDSDTFFKLQGVVF
jgi:hypothetical protein